MIFVWIGKKWVNIQGNWIERIITNVMNKSGLFLQWFGPHFLHRRGQNAFLPYWNSIYPPCKYRTIVRECANCAFPIVFSRIHMMLHSTLEYNYNSFHQIKKWFPDWFSLLFSERKEKHACKSTYIAPRYLFVIACLQDWIYSLDQYKRWIFALVFPTKISTDLSCRHRATWEIDRD